MTGRELIMYIIDNNLLDEPVFKNGVFVGYMSVNDAALELGAGTATIQALISMGKIDCIQTDNRYFIPYNFKKKGE